jgi:hypothetical protein
LETALTNERLATAGAGNQNHRALSGLLNPRVWILAAAMFCVASDDPDDLTLRQARWLGTADVVAFEPGVSTAILNRARADAVRIALAPGERAPERAGTVVTIRQS